MTLREDLKNWVPMYLWEEINHPEGYIVSNEEYNMRWNLTQSQGDQQANTIRDILLMLYDTILNEEDGASHIKVNLEEYSGTNLKTILKTIDTRLKDGIAALVAHRVSTDHDFKYYTKTELIEGVLDERYYNKTRLNQGQLDTRYYTRAELTPWLRGGDTTIKEEVFFILNPNNGDGTFTYETQGMQVIGELTEEGHQIFELLNGIYALGMNRLEVIINDTLRRSVASGGVEEIDIDRVALTSPEGAGAEITIKYYERLGIAAEYNVVVGPDKPPQNEGKNMWFRILE